MVQRTESLSNGAVEAPNQINLILLHSLTIVREWHFVNMPMLRVIRCKQRHGAQLNEAETAQFQLNEVAREYFLAEPPSYRKAVLWWIVSAKKVDTRRKRLATLIDDSAYGRTIAPLTL